MLNMGVAQRNSSSSEGVILNSQSNTMDLLVSTSDSVGNSGDQVGSRVVVDSEGDTLVRESPSGGSMSTLLGSFEDGHLTNSESDCESIEMESNHSEGDAQAETEHSPDAKSVSDCDNREAGPSTTTKGRGNVRRAAKDATRRLTRSMGAKGEAIGVNE